MKKFGHRSDLAQRGCYCASKGQGLDIMETIIVDLRIFLETPGTL